MRMTKETTEKLTVALAEMAQNELYDGVFPSYFAVTVNCKDCKDFHLYVYDIKDMLMSFTPSMMVGLLMFDSSEADVIVRSCKSIGAQITAADKEILAASMIACANKIDIHEDVDVKHMSKDEVYQLVAEEIGKAQSDKVDVTPTLNVATHASPDIYFQLLFDIEILTTNDMLLSESEREDVKHHGNFYEPLEAIIDSSRMLQGIQLAICGEAENVETPLSPVNEEKFRSFISKVQMSLKVENIA